MKRYKTKTINGIRMYQSRDGWRCCDDRHSDIWDLTFKNPGEVSYWANYAKNWRLGAK
jgi:hypothetical protein